MTIELTPEQLHQAASDARYAASNVRTARQASAAALSNNAFGVLCSPLMLPAYSVVQSVADSLMDAASGALDRAGTALDASGQDFATTDALVGQKMRQLRPE